MRDEERRPPLMHGHAVSWWPDMMTLYRDADIRMVGAARCFDATVFPDDPKPNAIDTDRDAGHPASVLMVAAVSLSVFLSLETMGCAQQASVIDTILAYSDGFDGALGRWLWPP